MDRKEEKSRLAQAKKNKLKDQMILVRNIGYFRPNRTTKMCYNNLRNFCTSVGLKIHVGNRKVLLSRIELLWNKRYELGQIRTNKDTGDWFTLTPKGKVPEDKLVLRTPNIYVFITKKNFPSGRRGTYRVVLCVLCVPNAHS